MPHAIGRWVALLLTLAFGVVASGQGLSAVVTGARADRAEVAPGGQTAIAITLTLSPGWHVNTNSPQIPEAWKGEWDAIPTEVTVEGAAGLKFGPVQWPAAHEIEWDLMGDGNPQRFGVYEGNVVLFVPVLVEPGASGELAAKVSVTYQACEKQCLPPTSDTHEVKFKVAGGAPAAMGSDPLFAAFDPKGFALVGAEVAPDSGGTESAADRAIVFDVFGWSFTLDPRGPVGLVLVVLVALAGGLIMNLTPCVLPVIPLKVMSLTKAGGERSRVLLLGMVMAAGVVAFWAGMGVIVAASTSFKSVSQIMGYWYVTLGIGVFIAIMGAGMLGAFAVGLPDWVYSIQAGHDSLKGSFVFGVLTAVLAAPCVAPLWGTVAGWAAFQPPWVTLLVFGAGGVGMALPYFVLALKPQWLSRVPRTGPASDLLKQVMGLLMFAVAAFFVGSAFLTLSVERPWVAGQLHWWVVAGLVGVAAVWTVARTLRLGGSGLGRGMVIAASLLLAAGGFAWAERNTSEAREQWSSARIWREYDPGEYERAKREGQVVVLDFTANWCFNCRTLENTVLSQGSVKDALRAPGVVAFKVDLSSQAAPGWAKLHDLGEVGIPLLSIEGPGLEGVLKSSAYTPGWVVEGVGKASSVEKASR